MSSLLEQAIVDAKELKDAAIKNAEVAILEKYSEEVKSAVSQLLEVEEDEMGLDLEPTTEEEEIPGAEMMSKLPDAHADGENLCPCPDEEEEITIDFDQLRAEMEADEAEGEMMEPAEVSAVDANSDEEIPLAEDVEISAEALEAILSEEDCAACGKAACECESEVNEEETVETAEATSEEETQELTEELEVDVKPVSDGWLGASDQEREDAEVASLAAQRDDEAAEELSAAKEALKDLEEKLNRTKSAAAKLTQKIEESEKTITLMGERLAEVNLTNAKLLYTNRVLDSNSLNERQKSNIVEAISKALSVEEAKTIYETLQSTVVDVRNTKTPQSLSEAVNKRPSPFLPRRNAESKKPAKSALVEQMQRLAGIKRDKQEKTIT